MNTSCHDFLGNRDLFVVKKWDQAQVKHLEQAEDKSHFIVKARTEGQPEETVLCRSVVVAAGIQLVPKIPAFRNKIPENIAQLHTASYRNPESIPSGAVLVVGSAQSGCQICEDLLSAGREVYLCTSKAGRVPRRYRGRDIVEWWVDMGFWDVTYASLEDKSASRVPQPQVSGVGRYGHTISLQNLARQGATILGRLHDVEENTLILGDEAAAHVRHADEISQRFKDDVDAYLEKAGNEPPPKEDDPADAPDSEAKCVSSIRRLNLREADINTVIWATGFTGDFGWIHLPVFDSNGMPVHNRGISNVTGLYFIGFPWLNKRKSGIIYGIEDDAQYIADSIAKQLA